MSLAEREGAWLLAASVAWVMARSVTLFDVRLSWIVPPGKIFLDVGPRGEGGDMTSHEDPRALEMCAFWLKAGPAQWFATSDDFDAACRERLALWEEAAAGGLTHWQETAAGAFAYIVLTDQIPRNVFRGTARQYETDAMALAAARRAVKAGHDKAQGMPARNFYYLPFQHAEDLAAQEEGLDLYRAAGDREVYYFALIHHDAIRRFGRFPHRNALFGRETTEAERAYLETGGFAA